MMLVESSLTLLYDVEKTELWKMFFAHGERQSAVVTPSLLGETLLERLERGGLSVTLNV
jgi:hypothetical protein